MSAQGIYEGMAELDHVSYNVLLYGEPMFDEPIHFWLEQHANPALPPPPPPESFINGHIDGSISSSTTGDPVLTPDPSTPERIRVLPSNVQEEIWGADSLATTLKIMPAYSPSLNISSPSVSLRTSLETNNNNDEEDDGDGNDNANDNDDDDDEDDKCDPDRTLEDDGDGSTFELLTSRGGDSVQLDLLEPVHHVQTLQSTQGPVRSYANSTANFFDSPSYTSTIGPNQGMFRLLSPGTPLYTPNTSCHPSPFIANTNSHQGIDEPSLALPFDDATLRLYGYGYGYRNAMENLSSQALSRQIGVPQLYNRSGMLPLAAKHLVDLPSDVSANPSLDYGTPQLETPQSVSNVTVLDQSSTSTTPNQTMPISAGPREPLRHLVHAHSSPAKPSRKKQLTLLRAKPQPQSPSDKSDKSFALSAGVKKKIGGRDRPLTESEAEHARRLREIKQCWPCAVNRERCSAGETCLRCISISPKSKGHGIGCNRTHIQDDLIIQFVPYSMDPSQLYRTDGAVQATQDIGQWLDDRMAQRGIEVMFSIGIGSPFTVKCHEYLPVSRQSMGNSTWHVESDDNRSHWRRQTRDSPPLGIKEYRSDEIYAHLYKWIDTIINDDLDAIATMYYWEGHMARTEILEVICTLYEDLQKEGNKLHKDRALLRSDLRKVISLVLVTYIMNHAFTVEETARNRVISSLSCDQCNPDFQTEYLVLKTANDQLKHSLSKIRYKMQSDLLSRLQTIMKHAHYKEWWLSSFVIMLGLALTLEEFQHLLHVQADARIAVGSSQAASLAEAHTRCQEIDVGFGFLKDLYHYKYSIRNKTTTSFAEWKHKVSHPPEIKFVEDFTSVFEDNSTVLLNRIGLPVMVSEENHVLRLVGRFLTSVM